MAAITTTRSTPHRRRPSRPRHAAPERGQVRHRDAGHRTTHRTPEPPRSNQAAVALRRRPVRSVARGIRLSSFDRARLVLVAMFACAALSAAAVPASEIPKDRNGAAPQALSAPAQGDRPACSPVLLDCCPHAPADTLSALPVRPCR